MSRMSPTRRLQTSAQPTCQHYYYQTVTKLERRDLDLRYGDPVEFRRIKPDLWELRKLPIEEQCACERPKEVMRHAKRE